MGPKIKATHSFWSSRNGFRAAQEICSSPLNLRCSSSSSSSIFSLHRLLRERRFSDAEKTMKSVLVCQNPSWF
ncbi:hypothetical protein CMV_030187 [Castanea mollissima]|uniref:Uncharacterized protein n=1 Tax=Castanea mollissima TaxID=60419 RepID=A0A8J4Q3Q7_9ROSI|nr:hypothetical protein CMV_030187 [Castanea mollissima]